MSSSPHRRVSNEGGVRVVVRDEISSFPSSFVQFEETTFVDKTLAIEAFLRNRGCHHLILRPRRCGKSFALSMIREFLQRPLKPGPTCARGIATTQFKDTAITEHKDIVSKYFQQYPVLHIDLKDVFGNTFEKMLASIDRMIREVIHCLSPPLNDLVDDTFCKNLLQPESLKLDRCLTPKIISRELMRFYNKPVVVLIDEYDTPMHSAIDNGYARDANDFFAQVFGSLLKGNDAVYASMMVGICRIAKSGWLSSLNNVEIFPMHAEDDRYARFFLFTDKEVEVLLKESRSSLSLESLREQYNGYTVKCNSGFVKLYNPLSIVRALEQNKVSNYWVETGKMNAGQDSEMTNYKGRSSPLSRSIWRAGKDFRAKIVHLLAGMDVESMMEEHVDYAGLDTISDFGLWGLLFHTGYISIKSFGVPFQPPFTIPNREVASQWREWVMNHLLSGENLKTDLSNVRNSVLNGDPERFQNELTTFLQERLSLLCTPSHKEKVYQTLCFMLLFSRLPEYDVRMEQDGGYGRSDIIAQPPPRSELPALLLEIKSVGHNFKRGSKKLFKGPERIEKDMGTAIMEALKQLEDRRYRKRVPLRVKEVHEFGLAFCGKFCGAVVRTLRRSDKNVWTRVSAVSGGIVDIRNVGEEGFADADIIMGDEDELEDA